jgi:Zn-dependent alcohol dehydrogenase
MVDQSKVVKIPGDMPMDRACLLACGVITGFGAVVNRANVKPLRRVASSGWPNPSRAAFASVSVIAADMLDGLNALNATHTVNGLLAMVNAGRPTGGRADRFIMVGAMPCVSVHAGPHRMAVIVGLATQDLMSNPWNTSMAKRSDGSFMGTTNLAVDVQDVELTSQLYRWLITAAIH